MVQITVSDDTIFQDSKPKEHAVTNCGNHTRYLVMVQGSLFLAVLMASVICWNPAMIVITDVASSPLHGVGVNLTDEDYNSPELPLADRRVRYTTVQKSCLFASIFVGALLGIVPMNYAMRRFGTHKTMIVSGVTSVITTALTPVAVTWDFRFLLVVRVLQGTSMSNPFPAIGAIITNWASVKESGLFVSILTGYIQISAVFSMPVSGVVSTSLGWPTVFYLHAIIGAVLLAVWAFHFRDDPSLHPFVGDREFRKISVGKGLVDMGRQNKVPYKAIFSSMPVWGIWAATACHYLVCQFSITYLPMYLVWVLNVPVAIAGLLSAIPLIVQFALKFITGMISDNLKGVSEVMKLRIFNTLALWGTGAVLVVCSFIPPSNQVVAVVIVLVAVSCQGFVSGGFPKAAVMVSKQYNTLVMAVMQVILCLALFGGSFLVPGITPDNSFEQYRWVFWIYALALFVGNVIFCALCSAEPAAWTKQDYAQHKVSVESTRG